MNILIAHPILSDNATLTASSANADWPVTNLQSRQPSDAWRSLSLSGVYLEADLGALHTVNFVSLIRCNATDVAQWRIRLASTQAALTSGPTYDSGTIDQWPVTGLDDWDYINAFHYISASPSVRWARIDFTDASNPDGYLTAGRLYISGAWVPTHNISYGWSVGYQDDSLIDATDGGNLVATPKGRRRVVGFDLNFSSESEMMANAFEIDRLRGAAGDIMVVPDTTSDHIHRQSVYGLSTELQPIINASYGIFTKRYLITEMI